MIPRSLPRPDTDFTSKMRRASDLRTLKNALNFDDPEDRWLMPILEKEQRILAYLLSSSCEGVICVIRPKQ